MKEIDINIRVQELAFGELSDAERELADAAVAATAGSYAPYSNFKVGAAVRLSNGVIVTGANQENAAFPSGTCAERSACFYAGAKYPDSVFEALAIAAKGTDGELCAEPAAPCGACRQALLEYEVRAGANIPVLLVGRQKVYRLPSVAAFLPLAFSEF